MSPCFAIEELAVAKAESDEAWDRATEARATERDPDPEEADQDLDSG
jgi:hypothetical protein